MTEAAPRRQVVMGAVQAAIAIAYPILIWFGLTRFEPRVLGLWVLAFAALRFGLGQRGAPQAFGTAARSLALPGLMIGATIGAVVVWNDEIGLLLMPVAISLAFLITFGLSLVKGPPMVERFARLQVEDLSPEEVAYCRRVTGVWCGFFVLNAGIAATLAGARLLDAWVLYTGLVSYVLMGMLFAAEYLYRVWRFRRYSGALTDPLLRRAFPPHSPLDTSPVVVPSIRARTRLRESDAQERWLEWDVPEDLAVWPGHFPEQALVPGVLQIEWIVREIEAWLGEPLRLNAIERLKFKSPVFPGEKLGAFFSIDSSKETDSSGERRFRIELRVRDEVATTMQVRAIGPACSADDEKLSASEADLGLGFEDWAEAAETGWPTPSAILPHAGNMLWLQSVLSHSNAETVARVGTEGLGLFRDSTGGAGAWLALEWMAQTVAAHDGIRRHARGEAIRPGMLLGTKKLALSGAALAPSGEYEVRVRHVFGGETGMVSYDCEVYDRQARRPQAKARLACRVGTPGAPLV